MSSVLLSIILGSCFVVSIVFAANHMTVPEIIRWHGYPCEEHFVTTEDGYILSLHRVPHGKNPQGRNKRRQPVMMQHGLLSSSASWALNLTHKTPVYLMADAGYDVWLTNIRGNTYSMNHTKLSPKSKKFWEFSWDQMARYDLPVFIDYILNETKYEQLYYIGHSMGTTIFFAGMSIHPEYNAKIKGMFALAPVGTVTFIDTWIAYFSHFQKWIARLMEIIGDYELAPTNSLVMKLVTRYCKLFSGTEYMCENLLFLIVGFDKSEFNKAWMPVVTDQLLSGTSLFTVLHYSQEYLEGRFQHYDYGSTENEKRYGQIEPPEYVMDRVTAPVHLIWGMNDYLADDRDVQFLIKKLPNVKSKCPVPFKKFNHLDFLWADNAKQLVYEPILEMMSKQSSEYESTLINVRYNEV